MTDKIDLDKDVNLNADELEQVKGGGTVAATGTTLGSSVTSTYDLKAAKK